MVKQKNKSKKSGMEVHKIPFDQVPQFSSKDVAYATAHPKLRPFFKYEVNLESFKQIILDKQSGHTDRKLLVEALALQYAKLNTTAAVKANIQLLLEENTFTVTTAHQPALFTGPLYYVLKIFSAINLAEKLKATYPDYNFVPVFINGAEDHDFEEINHTFLHQQRIEWNAPSGGSVGQLNTNTLTLTLNKLKDLLGESFNANRLYQMIFEAYTQNKTYGAATNQLVDNLFKNYGLVVVDMGAPMLKKRFVPMMEKEIFEQASIDFVTKTQEELEKVDFGAQAFARPINLFYVRPGIRARIVKNEDGTFGAIDTTFHFTAESLREELHQHPERFSPNVVMRPIYQELILPNLAYIGGGGELAYWLERKSQFEYFGLNFPMLIRRNSALWIPHHHAKKIKKLGLSIQELFMEEEALIKFFVKRQSENELSLTEELATLESVFEQYSEKAQKVDPTLAPRALAIGAKYRNLVHDLEKRLMRQEKKKYIDDLNQIRKIKQDLFPKNGLQERKHNFMNFFLTNGDFFFKTLKEELDPLEGKMTVFIEE